MVHSSYLIRQLEGCVLILQEFWRQTPLSPAANSRTFTQRNKADKSFLTNTKESEMAEKTDNMVELHAKIVVDAGEISSLTKEGYRFLST